MTLPGECVNNTETACMECGTALGLKVLASAAGGYYIGFFCPACGPYSRENGYFRSRGEAQTTLDSDDFGRP